MLLTGGSPTKSASLVGPLADQAIRSLRVDLLIMGAHGVSERAGVMGDRWGNSMGGTVQDSQYVWLPLKFPTKTTMTMDYSPKVTIDTATGKVTGMNVVQETLSVRSSGKCLDVTDYSYADGAALDQWTCNGGRNQQWERAIA